MIKRLFDITIAASILAVISPVILVIALLVRILLGSPVLFSQLRPGYLGRPFRMFKFRTMTNAVGADEQLLSDALRLTSFGKFLRATSIDESPALWNVLRGDMSLVGPRPLLMQYLPLYSREQARRHEVRPGITGWAQVNGRNALNWEEKFKLDVWYVDHQSLALDVSILAKTFVTVFFRRGISNEGHATMPVFLGTKKTEQSTKC